MSKDRCQIERDYSYGPGWFKGRIKLYETLDPYAMPTQTDEIRIKLSGMSAGCLDITVYLNGQEMFVSHLSYLTYPIHSLRSWLERIVSSEHTSIWEVDEEGSLTTFCVERLNCLNYCTDWGYHNEEERLSNYGLFYLYDSVSDSIKCSAIVNSKQLVNDFYMELLEFSGCIWDEKEQDFSQWFYDSCDKEMGASNWDFYNQIKSPYIEYQLHGKCTHVDWRIIKEPVFIKSFIVMDPDYGDALFWEDGVCCGGADRIWIGEGKDEIEIDLSSIVGLDDWQSEYERSYMDDVADDFYDRGWLLAKEVRKLFPDNVELVYYHHKSPHKYMIGRYKRELKLVPNERQYSLSPIGQREPHYMEEFRKDYTRRSKTMHEYNFTIGVEGSGMSSIDDEVEITFSLSETELSEIINRANYMFFKGESDESWMYIEERLPEVYKKIVAKAEPIAIEKFGEVAKQSNNVKYTVFLPNAIEEMISEDSDYIAKKNTKEQMSLDSKEEWKLMVKTLQEGIKNGRWKNIAIPPQDDWKITWHGFNSNPSGYTSHFSVGVYGDCFKIDYVKHYTLSNFGLDIEESIEFTSSDPNATSIYNSWFEKNKDVLQKGRYFTVEDYDEEYKASDKNNDLLFLLLDDLQSMCS